MENNLFNPMNSQGNFFKHLQRSQAELDKEKEEFKEEKEELTNYLYKTLDDIYSQIPKEATDVGMSTETAIRTYLPKLVSKASLIEDFIKRAEKIKVPWDLSEIKRDMEGWFDK